MTTTDRRDADDATFATEMDRLNRLDVADEDTVERVARAMWTAGVMEAPRSRAPWDDASEGSKLIYRRLARAAIAALKPAPGTDSSGPAVQRDENVVTCTHDGQPEHAWQPGEGCPDAIPAGIWAVRPAAAVAGPQRDQGGEGDQTDSDIGWPW